MEKVHAVCSESSCLLYRINGASAYGFQKQTVMGGLGKRTGIQVPSNWQFYLVSLQYFLIWTLSSRSLNLQNGMYIKYFSASVRKKNDQKQLKEQRVYFDLWLQRHKESIVAGKPWYDGSSRKLRDHVSSKKQRGSRKGEQEVESRKIGITVMCFLQQVSTP